MKTTHFLFTMIGCAALMHGVSLCRPIQRESLHNRLPGIRARQSAVISLVQARLPQSHAGGSVGNKSVINQTVRPPQRQLPLTGDITKKYAASQGRWPGELNQKHSGDFRQIGEAQRKNTAAINGTGMNHKP